MTSVVQVWVQSSVARSRGGVVDQEVLDLIGRARDGDAAAFRRLVDVYSGRVQSIAYQVVGHTEDARDISQEAFVKLYRSLGRFDPAQPFEPWLYRLTVNLAIDQRRRLQQMLVRRWEPPFNSSRGA